LGSVSAWLGLHLRVNIFASTATVGVIDEFVMRLLPAEIESASPGGFVALP
jgi:hypothetical protein